MHQYINVTYQEERSITSVLVYSKSYELRDGWKLCYSVLANSGMVRSNRERSFCASTREQLTCTTMHSWSFTQLLTHLRHVKVGETLWRTKMSSFFGIWGWTQACCCFSLQGVLLMFSPVRFQHIHGLLNNWWWQETMINREKMQENAFFFVGFRD